MRKIIILAAIIACNSCGVSITPVALKYDNSSSVELNQVNISNIGESLITKSESLYQDAYIITNTLSFSIKLLQFPYTIGDVLPLSGLNDVYKLYFKGSQQAGDMNYTAGIAENIETGELIPFTNSVNGFGLRKVDGFSAKKTTYYERNCSNCFKQEFIYNGKSNNTAKFIYREFVNDLARPSFNQEVQYDLNESNTIGFKGLRIEIRNITNSQIEYIVISDFE